MCLIVYGKVSKIRKLDLGQAWRSNPDGAGITIPARYPRIIKGIMTLATLRLALDELHGASEVALHFRMATHGAKTKNNTHPFRVDQETTMMHNGVIRGLGETGLGGASDSAHLARILTGVRTNKDRIALLTALEDRFILTARATSHILGDFVKEDGLWLSNEYWKRTMGFAFEGSSSRGYSKYYYNEQEKRMQSWEKRDIFTGADATTEANSVCLAQLNGKGGGNDSNN